MSKNNKYNFYLGVDEQNAELYAQLDANSYRIRTSDLDALCRAACHCAISDGRLSGISKKQQLEETASLACCIKRMKFVSRNWTQVEYPFKNKPRFNIDYIMQQLKQAIEAQYASNADAMAIMWQDIMEIRKLNLCVWLPNMKQYTWLRAQDTIVINPLDESDIQIALAHIIDTRGNQTIAMAINNAHIIGLKNNGKLPLPEEHFGDYYYVTYGHADKCALITAAMRAAHYNNSGVYLHSLANKFGITTLSEIKESIF